MQAYEIIIRLFLAAVFGAIIGLDREYKSRPAGVSTHILVCLGATLIALIQVQIMNQSLDIARQNPELIGVIRSDPARLICQVVSGIGFLGAGTIIITKRSVIGLTTAASLWAVAGIGLALGMGYYLIAVCAAAFVLAALKLVKRIIHLPEQMRLEVQYIDMDNTKKYIIEYFEEFKIHLKEVDFTINAEGNKPICNTTFILEVPRGFSCEEMVDKLALHDTISKIRLVNSN